MFFLRGLKCLKYIVLSRHSKGHGLHSPFVFNLVSKVFRNKINPDIVLIVEKIRKRMISDQRSISVMDLGYRSSKMKTSLRKVSEIARQSSVPKKYGILLSNMAAEFGESGIIEFGTSLGISTLYMAASNPHAVVYTMEGCPVTSEIAKDNFLEAGLHNIRLFTGSFEQSLPVIIKEAGSPGLIFIDGNHRREAVLRYFDQMAEISSEKTVIVIDDIHSSGEMEEAWLEVKKHEKVSFSIDIFRMGLVFLRGGMGHFNYIIRY